MKIVGKPFVASRSRVGKNLTYFLPEEIAAKIKPFPSSNFRISKVLTRFARPNFPGKTIWFIGTLMALAYSIVEGLLFVFIVPDELRALKLARDQVSIDLQNFELNQV